MARGWTGWVVAVAGMMAFAGCAGEDADEEPVERQSWEVASDASGCAEAIGVLLVELARLQAALPENLTAADAQGFLGLPAATGRGVLFSNGISCPTEGDEASTSGEVAIYIDAPTVHGAELEPVTYDLYSFAYHTSNETLRDLLADAGFEATGGAMEAAAAGGLPARGSYAIAEGAMVHDFTIDAVPGQGTTLTARFYNATEEGLVVWEYDIEGSAVAQGTVTSCSFGQESLLAELSGRDACGDGPTAGLVFPDQAWTGRVAYLHGASF